jgi:hypothetical protein
MLNGFTKVIDQAAAHVPAILWSPRAMRDMRAVVERFPCVKGKTIGPVRLGIIGMELRLAAGAAQVDLTLPILREDRDAIVALGRDQEDGAWIHAHPVWSRIWRFCCRWADPSTAVGEHVDLLWFEFDVEETAAPGLPVPGIFIGFKPESTARADAATWRQVLHEVVDGLTGTAPSAELLDHFEGALAALPRGAYVRFFGLMLSRGAEAVRFVIGGLGRAELPGLLAAVGWPGDADAAAERVLEATGEGLVPDAHSLQYDVCSAGVLPRIGIECALDRGPQTEGHFVEREFLQRLVDRSLCDADKRDALLALPGETVAPYDGICILGHARQVHHLKLVLDNEAVREAKAYYGRSLVVRRLDAARSTAVAAGASPGVPV